jgi:hypothetical protein
MRSSSTVCALEMTSELEKIALYWHTVQTVCRDYAFTYHRDSRYIAAEK